MINSNLTPNIEKVTFPTEFQTVLGLLEIIKDKDRIEKTLSEIKKQADKANALIDKVGKAQEIGKLHEKAKAQEKELETKLEEANRIALEKIESAKLEAETILQTATESVQKMIEKAENAERVAIQREKDSLVVAEEQKKLQTQLDAANQAQQKRQADLDKRESEIKRKEEILRQLA